MSINRTKDTHIPQFYKQRGNPLIGFEHDRIYERATIYSVDPKTYTVDVLTEQGKFITGIPWPSTTYSRTGVGGEISVPKRGQIYELKYTLGYPTLGSAILDPSNSEENSIKVSAVSGYGGEEGIYEESGAPNYRGNRPADLMPGDWIRISDAGNLIGVLEGGVTILKASELAQIIASAAGDILKLIGRNLDIYTDFGEISFKNNNGQTSLTIRGGAQQQTESSPETDRNFTINALLGAEGDLVDFEVTSPNGDTFYKMHITPTGDVEVYTHQDKKEDILGNSDAYIKGTKTETIGGDHNEEVSSNKNEIIYGNKSSLIAGTHEIVSGTDLNLSANRDINIASNRKINVIATGTETAGPSDNTIQTTITNGSLFIDIGNPSAGDLQKALSSMVVKTSNGNIDLSSLSGKIQLKTNIVDSVLLGGSAPAFHAMLYEMFEVYMEIFGNLIDTHVHATGVGPTSPPLVLPYTMSKSGIKAIKSNFVTIGG